MADVRKGYCGGCPYDFGKPATENAFNWGCLPTIGEIAMACRDAHSAWACHSEPTKVCCGFAAANPQSIDKPLLHIDGVNAP